jgi:hypothetical protein
MAAETAVGVFHDRAQAEATVALLREHGFAADEVSIIMQNPTTVVDEKHDDLATGLTVGGAIGGIGGLLAGAGLLSIPVIGPVLAVGPLLAALGGMAAGAGAGGLVGALTSAGVHETHAVRLAGHVQDGAVLVTIDVTPRHEEARALLRQAGASETDFSLTGDENAYTHAAGGPDTPEGAPVVVVPEEPLAGEAPPQTGTNHGP